MPENPDKPNTLEEEEALLYSLSQALECVNANIPVTAVEARFLFRNPQKLKALILACWLTEEQGSSEFFEALPFGPDVLYATLAAACGISVGDNHV